MFVATKLQYSRCMSSAQKHQIYALYSQQMKKLTDGKLYRAYEGGGVIPLENSLNVLFVL